MVITKWSKVLVIVFGVLKSFIKIILPHRNILLYLKQKYLLNKRLILSLGYIGKRDSVSNGEKQIINRQTNYLKIAKGVALNGRALETLGLIHITIK
jgi:hypothetical protein